MELYSRYTDVRKTFPNFEITQKTVEFSVSLKIRRIGSHYNPEII